MSPRRDRRVSSLQAAAGLLAIGLVVAGIVGLSYLLLLPAEVEAELPAAEEPPSLGSGARGTAVCPEAAPSAAAGEPLAVTSEDLVECPDLFDGREVIFEGEAVGAVMRRGRWTWLHVNDDEYGRNLGPLPSHRLAVGGNAGMAIVAPQSVVPQITTGSFNTRGTGLSITGTYYKNHPADPGAPAIEAETVEVARQPLDVDHPISRARLVAAAALALLTLVLAVVWRRTR